ncbi:MAG TPA: YgjP-like metallopeptidase domain-containing protein [Nitrososphaeraceae archaeon]
MPIAESELILSEGHLNDKRLSASVSFLPIRLSDGRILNMEIKRSKKTRRFWLKADMSGIYMVVPENNYEINQAIKFLESKKLWILRTVKYYERARIKCGSDEIQSNSISFLGKMYRVILVKDTRFSITISNALSKITFHVTNLRQYKNEIKHWYYNETRRVIAERLGSIVEMNPMLPVYNKVLVKDHKSRWASCSEKKNLNFSLLLAALPVHLIDYVIIHELAHLIQLNHSKKFWEVVKGMDPEFQAHRKMLNKYSMLIRCTSIN